MIDLQAAKETLEKFFNDMGMSCSIEDGKNNKICCKVESSITSFGDKGGVLCIINVFASEIVNFEFIFDKLNKNSYTLQLLNEHNSNDPWFKSYISERGYLTLMHTVFRLRNDMLSTYLSDVFGEMVSADNLEDLKPLVELTE